MKRLIPSLMGLAILLAMASPAQAQLYVGSESYAGVTPLNQNTPGVGNFNPWNTTIVPDVPAGITNPDGLTYYQLYGGKNFCAPTTTIMGMEFLRSTLGVQWYNVNNPYASVNTIGGGFYMATNAQTGTPGPDIVGGTTDWLAAQAGPTAYASLDPTSANDAASFIASKLDGGWAVQLGIRWGGASADEGGHFLTITGIFFDADGEGGTIDFIDPWDASTQQGSLSVAGSYLRLTYMNPNGGAAGVNDPDPGEADDAVDYDGPGDAMFGDIDLIQAELPEPTSIGFVAVATVGLLTRRSRRTA